jgi:hypothetical protein
MARPKRGQVSGRFKQYVRVDGLPGVAEPGTAVGAEPTKRSFPVYLSAEEKALLIRAAEVERRPVGHFLVSAALQRARELLGE